MIVLPHDEEPEAVHRDGPATGWSDPLCQCAAEVEVAEADAAIARLIGLAERGARDEAHGAVLEAAAGIRDGWLLDRVADRLRGAADAVDAVHRSVVAARAACAGVDLGASAEARSDR